MTSGEHSESANLRQGQNLTGVIVFHGGGGICWNELQSRRGRHH